MDFKLATVSLSQLQITDNNYAHTSFQTLPPEIIVGIFECLLGYHGTNKSPYHFLLPVTQTSTRLRQTALAAPPLWSMIEINDKPASFNFAKVCLGRSGNHKLDISIRVLKRMESKINGLLAMLRYASPRTRSLELRLSFANPEQWDLWCESFSVLDLGALESLEFEAWRREITTEVVPPPPNVIPLSDTISSLRILSLGQTSIPPDPQVLSKLTRLALSSASFWAWPYYQIFEVLQCCPVLEELELQGVGLNTCHGLYPADRLPSVPRLQCPNLRRLTFFGVENNIPPLIITNLTAPSLEVVSLETPKLLSNDIPFTWAHPPTVLPFDSVRSLLLTDGPTLGVHHQDHFALFLSAHFLGTQVMEIAAIRCRALFITWADQVNIALNPWKDLQSLDLTYQAGRCMGYAQEVLRETFRFLDARRRAGSPPLGWLRLGLCDECQYTDREETVNGIKRLLHSRRALEYITVTH